MVSSIVINVFRVLAACTSMMMILSPIPTVYRIHKTHKTGHMSIFPLISVVFNCHTWMMYGYLDENIFPVFSTFVAGDVISIVYIFVFFRWTSERRKAAKILAVFGLAIVLATTYALLAGFGYTRQSRHDAARFSGYVAILAALILYSSPLGKVVKVFRHKSAVFIPIHMVIAGTTNNAVWVIYTSLAGKWLMFVPNLITLVVGVFQIIVYFFVYHPKSHPLANDWKTNHAVEDFGVDGDDGFAATPTPSEDDADLESPRFVSITTPTELAATVPPPPHMQV